jgi:hypothetical protein
MSIINNSIDLLNSATFSFNNSYLEEEDDLSLSQKNREYFFINKPENRTINEKPTADITSLKNNNKNNFTQNQRNNNALNKPDFYNFKEIKQIFSELQSKENFNIFNEINKIFEKNKEFIDKLINEFLKIKSKKPQFTDFESKNFEELFTLYEQKLKENMKPKIKKNLGRKRKTDDPGKHDKMSHDNIIKKLKAIIFDNIINFLNNILKPVKEAKFKLLQLSYEFINKLKRDEELKNLNSSLKELASKQISKKYKTKLAHLDFNKRLIENILKNQNDPTILFAFNLSLKNWIDLFCRKKTVNQLLIENNLNESDIDYERINNSLIRLDTLLYDIKINNSSEYLISFIFLLYNYEAWFYLKKGRNKKDK